MTNITTHNETVLCDDGNYCSDVMGGRKYTRHKIIHFHPTTRIANSSYCILQLCSDSGIAEAYRAWKMQFLDPHNEGYGPPLTLSLTLKRLFFNTPLYQTAEKSLCTCKAETLGMFCNEASLIEWGRRCQYGFNGLVAHLAFDLQTCSWISIAVAN